MFEKDEEYWERPYFYYDKDYNIPDECRMEHSPQENYVEYLREKYKREAQERARRDNDGSHCGVGL